MRHSFARKHVDCCCVAFDPKNGKVWCTERGLRALRHASNIVDSAFASRSYATRIEKYAKRGFAAAVPYMNQEGISPHVLRARYCYFEHSDMLLRLGRFITTANAPRNSLQSIASCRRATIVEHLQRLVIMDAGTPIVQRVHHDKIPSGEIENWPLWTGETGEYVVVNGIASKAKTDSVSVISDGNDFYVSLAMLLPGIVEKAYAVDEDRRVPPSPEQWKSGGLVRRKKGKLTSVTESEDAPDALDEQIICAYDLVSCGAAYHDLRYIHDARQGSMKQVTSAEFEQRYGLPATLVFFEQQPRGTVGGFTRDVFV